MSNPFFEEEEDDSYSFGNKNRNKPNTNSRAREEANVKIEAVRDESLQSTQRALAAMNRSQDVGVETLVTLDQQAEQFDRIERNLQQIDETTNMTQRNLTGMKSLFGGIKNWLSSGKGKQQSAEAQSQSEAPHRSAILTSTDQVDSRPSGQREPRMVTKFQPIGPDSARERQINQNLEEMSMGIGNLKNLANSLGSEIDRQNTQLERITSATDKADAKIKNQRGQMDKLLGKK